MSDFYQFIEIMDHTAQMMLTGTEDQLLKCTEMQRVTALDSTQNRQQMCTEDFILLM